MDSTTMKTEKKEKSSKRFDWTSVEVLKKCIDALRLPITKAEFVSFLKGMSSTAGYYTADNIIKRLELLAGNAITRKAGGNVYLHIIDVDNTKKNLIMGSTKSEDTMKVAETPKAKRGSKTGPRKETWRELLKIIDIILKNGGSMEKNEIIRRYNLQKRKDQSDMTSIKLDRLGKILDDLGVPFVNKIGLNKRLCLEILNPNIKILVLSEYKKLTGEVLEDDKNYIKVSENVVDPLSKMTESEKNSVCLTIAEILYLHSEDKYGVEYSNISSMYRHRNKIDISEETVHSVIQELKRTLGDAIAIYETSAKILRWQEVLRIYDPSRMFTVMVIKVSKDIDVKKMFINHGTLVEVDSDEFMTTYEISVPNNLNVSRSMMNLVLEGGRILYPNRLEKKVYEVLRGLILDSKILL